MAIEAEGSLPTENGLPSFAASIISSTTSTLYLLLAVSPGASRMIISRSTGWTGPLMVGKSSSHQIVVGHLVYGEYQPREVPPNFWPASERMPLFPESRARGTILRTPMISRIGTYGAAPA